MRRETAYKLAGRHHKRPAPAGADGVGRAARHPLQAAAAGPGGARLRRALQLLKGLQLERTDDPLCIVVRYSGARLLPWSWRFALREAGFALENSLYIKLVRALVYFSEETQRRNLLSPSA